MTNFFHTHFGLNPATQTNILISAVTIIIFVILYRLIVRLLIDRFEDPRTKYQWKKITLYLTVTVAVIIITRIWFGFFEGFATYFGLLSAGIAIALKDPIVNLAAWIFILIRKPFKIGDRIQINNITGDVIDIRIFQFSLMEVGNWVDADQSTGRIIHIPNGTIFTSSQANYTTGFEYIWNEIPVLITFESDWEIARSILNEIIGDHSLHLSASAEKQIKEAGKKFLITYQKLTPIVYTTVKDSGVLLTIRYLCKVRERRITEDNIWSAILEKFAKHKNIDFAYPTQRFFNNSIEGKKRKK